MRGLRIVQSLVALSLVAAGCNQFDGREPEVLRPGPARTGETLAAEADAKLKLLPEERLPIPAHKPVLVAGLPIQDPGQLMGLDDRRIVALLGEPAAEEEVPPAKVWTYRGKNCALQLFFYAEINTQEFRALTYEMQNAGPTEDDKRRCLREVMKADAG